MKNFGNKNNRISYHDLVYFCKQYEMISASGLMPAQVLQVLSSELADGELKSTLDAMQKRMKEGADLYTAMQETMAFPAYFIQIIRQGEAHGNIHKAFAIGTVIFEQADEREQMMRKAVYYPAFLLLLFMAIVYIMLVLVVPYFMKMFSGLSVEMSGLSHFVVGCSSFCALHWFGFLVLLSVPVILYFLFMKRNRFVIKSDSFKRRGLAFLSVQFCCASFTRVLWGMLSEGVSVEKAVLLSAEDVFNENYSSAIMDAAVKVCDGSSLKKALGDAGIFPPVILHMVAIGEEMGTLTECMRDAALYYEGESKRLLDKIMHVIEPFLIIFIAIIVFLIICGIMQPMLNLFEAVGFM